MLEFGSSTCFLLFNKLAMLKRPEFSVKEVSLTDKFTLKLHVQKKIQRNQELEEKVEATTYLTSLLNSRLR